MKKSHHTIAFCEAELGEATRLRSTYSQDFHSGKVQAFTQMLAFLKEDEVAAIEPIKPIEPAIGTPMQEVYVEMVEKFNQMLDQFNRLMEKIDDR